MTFVRIRRQDMPPHMAGKPHDGWRLRLERVPGENAVLSEERVLPEKLDAPDAERREEADVIWLTTNEVQWLRDACNELLSVIEAEDAKDLLGHLREAKTGICSTCGDRISKDGTCNHVRALLGRKEPDPSTP